MSNSKRHSSDPLLSATPLDGDSSERPQIQADKAESRETENESCPDGLSAELDKFSKGGIGSGYDI